MSFVPCDEANPNGGFFEEAPIGANIERFFSGTLANHINQSIIGTKHVSKYIL